KSPYPCHRRLPPSHYLKELSPPSVAVSPSPPSVAAGSPPSSVAAGPSPPSVAAGASALKSVPVSPLSGTAKGSTCVSDISHSKVFLWHSKLH
ncbi:hypothetical protein PIB30_073194, partial [Stylosanthes scabra]|nr:hypothetical protein [Stylosanthes scabra]